MPIMINCFCHLISFGISGCLVLGNFQNTHVLADISTSLMPDILSFFPILWLNLASVIVSEHAISIVCSQGLINCLSQDLASSPAAVVRFALYSWTTSYSSTLFLFPLSCSLHITCPFSIPSLYGHGSLSAPGLYAWLQVLFFGSMPFPSSYKSHFPQSLLYHICCMFQFLMTVLVTYFPACHSLCSYAVVQASGFEMIIGLGTSLWVCLVWEGILFLGYCLLSEF